MKDLCVCTGCKARIYHKTCWPKASFHLPSDSYENICKPPADFVEYVWINDLLKSEATREDQAMLHRKDMWSSWIKVPNQQDKAELYVWPRLEYLITNAQAVRDDDRAAEQFPSLVSFFGDTGYEKFRSSLP